MIAVQGVYQMPAAEYHADPCPEPSLSSSIAKLLCLSSPAHAYHAHPRLNVAAVEEESTIFNIGTAAHALLLEETSENVVVIDAADWRTKAAKDARDLAYQLGKIPLLASRWVDVQAMVAAARDQLADHTDGAADMFRGGLPERTLLWQERDVWCRARLDYLRPSDDPKRAWFIDDYKTTENANPESWSRSLFFNGFDIQVAWYRRAVRAITGAEAVFRFAVQETSPPYALAVVALGPDALTLAEKKVLYALEHWRECQSKGRWPGYPTRTCYASLPMAHESWWLEREMR